MSDRRSDWERVRERGSGSRTVANNPAAQSPYAAYQQMSLEPLIAERTWHNSDSEELDFHNRTVAAHYRFENNGDNVPRTYEPPGSMSSSMVLSAHSRSTASGSSTGSQYSMYLPTLHDRRSSAANGSSTRPGNANPLTQSRFFDQNDRMTDSPAPSSGAFACAYGFLGCSFGSDNFYIWDEHCRSHFRGHLPTSVQCPFECTWSLSAADGVEVWNLRNDHIARYHLPRGAIDQNRLADTLLIDHLWRGGLIDQSQMEDLRRYGQVIGMRRSRESGQAQRRGRRSSDV